MNPGGGNAVVRPKIVFGITHVASIIELDDIIRDLQSVADLTVLAPENVVGMIDKASLTCRVLSDCDGVATLLRRGRFLYEDLSDWATHVIVLADSDMIAQLHNDRSEGNIAMLLINADLPKLVIPQMPYGMWTSKENLARVKKLRALGVNIGNCVFEQARETIVDASLFWLKRN